MIVPVSRSNLASAWPVVTPGLSRALTKTTLGDYWTLDALFQGVLDEELFGFYQSESGYSGIFSINQVPKGKVLYFFWSGKDPVNLTPVDYEEVDEFLMEAALHFGATHINCEGRKGWRNKLIPLGYIEDAILYSKEVRNEPTEV